MHKPSFIHQWTRIVSPLPFFSRALSLSPSPLALSLPFPPATTTGEFVKKISEGSESVDAIIGTAPWAWRDGGGRSWS